MGGVMATAASKRDAPAAREMIGRARAMRPRLVERQEVAREHLGLAGQVPRPDRPRIEREQG